MVDWSGLAAEKYNQSQQELDNRRMVQEAEARQLNTRSNLMPGESASEQALRAAQASKLGMETNLMPGQVQADISKTYAGIDNQRGALDLARQRGFADMGLDFAKQNMMDQHSLLQNQLTGFQYGQAASPAGRDLMEMVAKRFYGFSDGTAHVPGHGDGTVDTVPAMLAPGEAVLNKSAAEMLGRGMIALLNKLGQADMGTGPGPSEGDVTKAAKGAVKGGKPVEDQARPSKDVKKVDPQKRNSGGTRPESRQGLACGTAKVQKHAKGTAEVTPSAKPGPTTGAAQEGVLGQLLRAIIGAAGPNPGMTPQPMTPDTFGPDQFSHLGQGLSPAGGGTAMRDPWAWWDGSGMDRGGNTPPGGAVGAPATPEVRRNRQNIKAPL